MLGDGGVLDAGVCAATEAATTVVDVVAARGAATKDVDDVAVPVPVVVGVNFSGATGGMGNDSTVIVPGVCFVLVGAVVAVAGFAIAWKAANAWQAAYDGCSASFFCVGGVDVLAGLVGLVLLPLLESP